MGMTLVLNMHKFNFMTLFVALAAEEQRFERCGYMRETSSQVWERKFFVTDTTAVINYSKDNYFFGVQSVDAEGHESLVVIPKAVR